MPDITISEFLADPNLIWKAHKAIEDAVIELRDARIAVMAGNGLCCRERDGTPSSIIRMRVPYVLRIGLEAVLKEI